MTIFVPKKFSKVLKIFIYLIFCSSSLNFSFIGCKDYIYKIKSFSFSRAILGQNFDVFWNDLYAHLQDKKYWPLQFNSVRKLGQVVLFKIQKKEKKLNSNIELDHRVRLLPGCLNWKTPMISIDFVRKWIDCFFYFWLCGMYNRSPKQFNCSLQRVGYVVLYYRRTIQKRWTRKSSFGCERESSFLVVLFTIPCSSIIKLNEIVFDSLCYRDNERPSFFIWSKCYKSGLFQKKSEMK